MNLTRVIRLISFYLFLTGYQIRWYDHKLMHYRLTISGTIYFIILSIVYLVCFCHHFEGSSMLKILTDISPFLQDLVRLHVLLGLKVYIFCLIETKNSTKIFNNFINVLKPNVKHPDKFDISEIGIYFLFFTTLLVGLFICLYIAIELKFEMPTVDQVMIGMALFMPHVMLSGCLRFYTLGLWLMQQELRAVTNTCLKEIAKITKPALNYSVTVEIINPVLNKNSNNSKLYDIYEKISKRVSTMAEYLHVFDRTLQRQLSVLMGLNFNCLLAGAYVHLYFENFWKILFSNRYSRAFYAANGLIFVCILLDYAILLITRWKFCRAQQNLYNLIVSKLFGNKQIETDIKNILKEIKTKLSKKLELHLFGLIEFNAWNFLLFQGLMILIIAVIVAYHYLSDQIKMLNERIDANDSE